MKQSQPLVCPHHKYLIGTDNYEDMYKISKMPGGNSLAKVLPAEAYAFHNLETQ